MSMQRRILPLGVVAILLAVAGCSEPPAAPTAAAKPLTEKEKIERLIAVVAEMKGVTFVRKGTTYDCKEAADFMKGKWQWKSSEIKTAEDFVRVCSAGGSGEGTPYYIRFSDGREETSAKFLGEELAKMEGAGAAAARM
jgi:hypothetical protein